MKKFNLLVIFLLFLIGNLDATNYYVDSANGNDSLNSGKNSSSAWKTIDKVNKYSSLTGFIAGDTISFKCGQRFQGTTLIPQNSGTVSLPIVFNSYGSGDRPIIDRNADTSLHDVIYSL
ncbi:MAG: hypothetical protein P4L35_05040 [Ignavibacteriaceae bacterium]|nr:hypothetical protein [Ignavibacteriaceae bacterium]